MAGKVLCDATNLYNILNQYTRQSRLADSNYLCLIDARPAESYNFSHIITARNAKWDSEGNFIMSMDVEIECMRYIIVYDGSTNSLLDSGPAIDCANSLQNASCFPIQILTGGFEKFSALYPFLGTQKILYTIREIESLKPYPVEILPGQLYMGGYMQAANPQILKDLKLKALVNVSENCSLLFEKANCTVLHINIADSVEADLFISFERICAFIDSHLSSASSVMIFSTYGISRCSAVAMAYLMYRLKYTLKDAWNHIQKCKANMRPNRGFVQQLSAWELETLGQKVTDISEPNY